MVKETYIPVQVRIRIQSTAVPPNFTKRTSREKKIATKSLVPFPFQLRCRKETPPPRSEGAPSPESFSEPQLPSNTKAGKMSSLKKPQPGTRPKLHRSRIGSRHRLMPRGSRGRSARHPTAAPTTISAPMTKRVTSTAASPHRRNNGRRRLLYRSQRKAGLHLHELVGGTGVEHHQGEEELERTLLLRCASATASPPQPDTET